MQINTNLYSLAAQASYRRAGGETDTSVQRLSSGLRINSARDDAAGLAIAQRLSAGVNGLSRAAQNTDDGMSLLQVAGGALGSVVDNLQRMRELAVQAANDSNGRADRQAIQREADQLVAANFEIADGTSFNHMRLLDGSYSGQFQVGANGGDTIFLTIPPIFMQGGTTSVTGDTAISQATVSGQVAGALGVGDLTINGKAIGASVPGQAVGQSNASAYAIAAAINSAAPFDLAAAASNTLTGTAAGGAAIPGAGLSINGIALGAITGADANALAASAAAVITAAAGSTGVSASASGATLNVTAADGRDIDITESQAGYAGLLGLGTGMHRGSVSLSSSALPTNLAHSIKIGGNNPGAAGFAAGPVTPVVTGATSSVLRPLGTRREPAIDLSSFAGATAALTYIDGKLESCNTVRSLLGATENRLAIVRNNLSDAAANLSAARARVRDTDYASETAQLTRSQILRQAGMAMLAQANAQPGQALQLLR